ncbi:endo alpha-1,4 polygalactosaminidase [Dictyoglomus sp.]|uniref:endo alpha-1,4 polygalactosaminidase n=1 Tax=Dictyoglomus sp. TaxID=28205 RepID=UPI003D14E765
MKTKISKTPFLTFAIIILIVLITGGQNTFALKGSQLSNIKNFVFFYGRGEVEKLEKYDLIVIQDYTLTKDEVNYLKSKGKKVVVYVTIGESDTPPTADLQNCVLGKNVNWNSWYMDAGCEKWQNLVINKMKNLLIDKNYDGFFLDTVDTAVLFPQTKDGMVSLIKKIRDTFPKAILIQNRGFPLLEYTGDYIDAVLWEDFASGYNFQSGKYEKNSINDLYVRQQIELAKRKGYIILTLNYAEEDDVELINYVKEVCQKYNLLYSITDLYISKVYDLSAQIKERTYTTDNVNQLIIIGRNDKDFLYGDGWKEIENIWGTKARKCEGWGAGVVLTFKEKKDSIFYVTFYDGGIEEMALKITTFNGLNWPMIASLPVGDSEVFKTFEVKVKKEELYDNDPNTPGIQQKFGFQGAKVAFIGYPQKPELLFGKVEFTKKKDRVYFKVGNVGLMDAKNIKVVVKDENGNIIGEFNLERLDKNGDQEFTLKFSQSTPKKLTFIIDPENKIEEITKDNNILEVQVK